MVDICTFLLQTLYVSLTGGLILLVKWLLKDKLTPRWQYGVWSVLALRIFLPVPTIGAYVLLPLPLWVETLKVLMGETPVTRWLFLLYAAGVVVVLLRYLVAYLRLKALLRHGKEAPTEIQGQVRRVGETYALNPCSAVVIPGLPSPMVCGVWRPVLALPEGSVPDDHVILHELLHIRYRDALQNVFWCVCRALHWCNPFVWYLMDRVGNDMESLCDQRVLERLEGEERRAYGLSLLMMANDRYPRAPGTTSVSNGGKNIARRIEAIVRFKKYPSGMALASLCVTAILAGAVLFPTSVQGIYTAESEEDPWKMARAEASMHLVQCTTPAGAISMYADGLIYGKEDYLTLAFGHAPERQAGTNLFSRKFVIHDVVPDALADSWYDTGESYVLSFTGSGQYDFVDHYGYVVHNLRSLPDGSMAAEVAFLIDYTQPDNTYCSAVARCEILLHPSETGWHLEETGAYDLFLGKTAQWSAVGSYDSFAPFEPNGLSRAEGTHGTVTKESFTALKISREHMQYDFFGNFIFSNTPYSDPNAEFSEVIEYSEYTYTFKGTPEEKESLNSVTIQTVNMPPRAIRPGFIGVSHGSGSWGDEFGRRQGQYTTKVVSDDWDGIVQTYHSYGTEYEKYSSRTAVQIAWNLKPVEEMILEEVRSP